MVSTALVSFLACIFNLGLFIFRRGESDGFAALCSLAVFAAVVIYNMLRTPTPAAWPPLRDEETRLVVIGYSASPPTAHAHYLAHKIAKHFPTKFSTWYHFSMFDWWKVSMNMTENVKFPPELKGHSSSPFVAVYTKVNGVERCLPLGGDAEFSKWVLAQKYGADHIDEYAKNSGSVPFLQMFHSGIHRATTLPAEQ